MTLHRQHPAPLHRQSGRDENGKVMVPSAADWTLWSA